MEELSVALMGLGTMGKGMASSLLKAGFPLTVYNRTIMKARPLLHWERASPPAPRTLQRAQG